MLRSGYCAYGVVGIGIAAYNVITSLEPGREQHL